MCTLRSSGDLVSIHEFYFMTSLHQRKKYYCHEFTNGSTETSQGHRANLWKGQGYFWLFCSGTSKPLHLIGSLVKVGLCHAVGLGFRYKDSSPLHVMVAATEARDWVGRGTERDKWHKWHVYSLDFWRFWIFYSWTPPCRFLAHPICLVCSQQLILRSLHGPKAQFLSFLGSAPTLTSVWTRFCYWGCLGVTFSQIQIFLIKLYQLNLSSERKMADDRSLPQDTKYPFNPQHYLPVPLHWGGIFFLFTGGKKKKHKEVTQVLQGTYNLDKKWINFGSINMKFCISVKSTVKMLFLNSFLHNPMILLAWNCTPCSERLWP